MAKHRSSQDWCDILSAYDNCGVTQETFCAEYGISLASLHYHRRKRRAELAGCEAPKLIELPSPVYSPSSLSPRDCQIEYLNPALGQLKISCRASQIGQIIKELSSTGTNDLT